MDNEEKAFKYFSIACRTMYYTHCESKRQAERICGTLIGVMLLDGCTNDDIEETFMKVLNNWEEIIEDMKNISE